MRRAGVGALLALTLAACGSGGVREAGAARGPSAVCGAERGSDVDLGGPLRAWLHVPRGGGDGPWPLVVALHGAGATGNQASLLGFSTLGDREGFAALYPSAQARRFWSLNRAASPDDLPPFADLLRALDAEPCIGSILVTGVSNGGGFAARAGCELDDVVDAIAPVAGGYRALERCRARRAVGVFELHGAADSVVPYHGRPPSRAGSVPRYLRGWARRNGCARRPVTTRPRRLVVAQRWRGCDPGGAVRHLRLERTGHGWPGLFAARPGDPARVDATREIWRFFARL